eukprot:6193652-Pleurochrysis_carterae.AAC.2
MLALPCETALKARLHTKQRRALVWARRDETNTASPGGTLETEGEKAEWSGSERAVLAPLMNKPERVQEANDLALVPLHIRARRPPVRSHSAAGRKAHSACYKHARTQALTNAGVCAVR